MNDANIFSNTVLRLANFLLANAPVGAERSLAYLRADIAQNNLTANIFTGMEFRPTDDTSCTLYVKMERSPSEDRVEDSDGNIWVNYQVSCEISWQCWGSCSIEQTQRRLALMTLVQRFATEVQREFQEPIPCLVSHISR